MLHIYTLSISFIKMLALTLAALSAAPNTTLLAFGDSWAWLGYDQLKDVMQKNGVSTALKAIPGTPAGYWALIEPHALVNAVDANNATHVYLSLGGNDFLEGLPLGLPALALYAEMMTSTKKVLHTLFAARPHVHVHHFGYEILDWSASAFCRGFGNVELKGKAPLFCEDTSNVTCMTHTQATWLQNKFVDQLAEYFRGLNQTKYHGHNLLGTLQVAGGVEGAKVGEPNWDKYSPTQYVRKEDGPLGCVHLTPEGYTALYTELAKRVVEVKRRAEEKDEGAVAMVEDEPRAKTTAHAERRACRSNARRQCVVIGN